MHFEAQRAGELRNENAFNLAGPIGWDQLVGHSKGAFTDASSNREGLLKVTQGGTLVIQEIGDMPIEQQVQLLTVLCEREYHRVGEAKPIPLSTQVIATTCHDVEDLVAKGKFRKELLYRFQRRVHITPLRERIEDVRAIVHGWHFEKPEDFPLLDDEAIALLQGYDWPGNVRQLQNVFERLRAARDWSLAAIRREIENELRSGGSPQAEAASGLDLDPEEQELLDLIPWDRAVRRRDLEEASPGAAKNTLVHRLNRLVEKRLVCRVGSGPNLRYRRLWKPVDEG
jgi:DNA-binding NtrC family response regulator